MNKDPAFLFYSSDFLTGVSFFSNEEIGLYVKLLCYQHQHGGIIPKDFFNNAIALLPNIKSKFIECDDGFFNERLMEEMEKRAKKSKSLSDNALIRWKKHKKCKSNANAHANAMQTENENENENINTIKNRELIFKNKTIKEFEIKYSLDLINEFLDYWTEPNKSGTKMRWELEKTWDTARRLKTWASRSKIFNKSHTKKFGHQSPTNEELRAQAERLKQKGII